MRARTVALWVVNITNLMLVIANNSVSVALPDIQRAFDLTPAGLSWVVTAYALAFAGLILVSGKLGAIYGSKRMLVIGAAVFIVGSAATGLAPDALIAIVARIVQGVGAALAAPSTLVLLMANTEAGPKRTRALGVFVLARAAGGAVGLILGGILASSLGWESVMFVNVPVGIAIIVLGLVFVRETETKKVPLDYLGAVLSTLVMAALIFGFTSAASDGWASAPALVSFAVGVIAVAALILVERRHPDAVVPLQLFGSMRAVSAYAAMLLVPAGLFAYFYFLALFVQKTLGYDALGTGFALLPYVLVLIAVSQLTPRLMPRLGEKWAGVIGIVLTAVGLGLLGLLTEGSTYVGGILVPSLILGIGAGISLGPLTSVVMHFAPSTHVSEASSMLQAVQQLGGGVGVAALTTLYVAGIGRGGAGAEGIAGGVSLAMLGGAGFAVVAFILYVIWGARVTPKAATAADVEAEVAEEAEREATLVD